MRFFVLIVFTCIISCNSIDENSDNDSGKEITLINKTNKAFKSINTITLKDKRSLNTIYNLLKYSNRSINAKVRNNRGYIEVVYSKSHKNYFYIIFSETDGPIVRYKRKYYKNDELIKLIEGYLKLNIELKEHY
ncbi:hypothetical protein [Aquimarina rhabdastrellae]